MAFTNFCCRSGGSNLNAGTRTGDTTEPGTAADITYASGNWVQSTRVFTVASGDPVADGVAVGDFASVYADGSTVTGFVGRVTARTSTTITISATASSGTAPTDGTGNRTLKIGGAWQGPNGTSGFPFGFIGLPLTNVAGNTPRVNFKNDASFAVTAAISFVVDATTGRFVVQGYTSAYGDGGKATLDGGTSGAAYALFTGTGGSAGGVEISDFIFQNNGASSVATLVTAVARMHFRRCEFAHSRGHGLSAGHAFECEAYDCNQSNTATRAGFVSCSVVDRCIAHDNAGSNTLGFLECIHVIDCIADSNGGDGAGWAANTDSFVSGFEAYNNGGDGLQIVMTSSLGSRFHISNSNFVKNGGFGINIVDTSGAIWGEIRSCGFGAGTQANTSGAVDTPAASSPIQVIDSVTYTSDVTPWVDPDNGDFRINLAAAKGAGRGAFPGSGGTVGYPDIGAAQHQDTPLVLLTRRTNTLSLR